MPVPGSNRLHFQFYRCVSCKRLLTKLEILRRWQTAELHPEKPYRGACPCGGGKLQATNMTPEEAERLMSLKQKLRYFIYRKVDHNTRVVELWRHEVLVVPRGLGWLVNLFLPKWTEPR